ncbi:hypothetical protein BDP81DRAFT_439426 [Colletotrichum phormii]|uniref:Uncharacterized protein n=1 Tax=Colletotrichum phormii TaxID=359342 RepID=A0AAI9ZHD7_9PEZI|nr:uncharacterized protein BDP81DRAFT_439426 [Colletotrichum phormii]KAK1623379.1 hypothetical protein BDP81DRAFT_439426 [Colletotrichum phormii]
MSRQFRLSHLFPLFVAIAHTIGGIVPFVAKDAGLRSFGLPERFAESTIAQSCFILDGARLSVLGTVQLIMYLRGDYAAVDIIMALLVYVGLVDGYVCWREGELGSAVFRATSGMVIGAWDGVCWG